MLAGGMLTEWAGWEWVLFVNVPIGIAAALLAPRILDESRDESNPSWDIAGAVTVTAGLALLVYTLVDANDAGWGSAQTIGLGALSLALLASFVAIELRRRYPLIPFSIFKLRTLRGSNVIGLLLGMSLFAMFFFISLYMQQVLGYDPLKAGLAYLPLAGLIIISAGGASQLVARFGFKPVLVTGLLFTAAGLFWFSRVSAPGGSYVGDVLFPEMLAAIGLGLSFVPVTIGAVTGTKPNEAGLASGLINTSQQVGGALGLAILSTIATNRTQDVFASGVHDPQGRPHRRLPGRVLRGWSDRGGRRAARARADLDQGQPRDGRGRAPGRGGPRRRPGLASRHSAHSMPASLHAAAYLPVQISSTVRKPSLMTVSWMLSLVTAIGSSSTESTCFEPLSTLSLAIPSGSILPCAASTASAAEVSACC